MNSPAVLNVLSTSTEEGGRYKSQSTESFAACFHAFVPDQPIKALRKKNNRFKFGLDSSPIDHLIT